MLLFDLLKQKNIYLQFVRIKLFSRQNAQHKNTFVSTLDINDDLNQWRKHKINCSQVIVLIVSDWQSEHIVYQKVWYETDELKQHKHKHRSTEVTQITISVCFSV